MEFYSPKYIDYLLDTPGESSKADYKAAVVFREDDEFSFKLVKHILGFANSGGGYIVIGFKDSDLTLDQNLTREIADSYDTTRLAQYVNSCITNNIEAISLVVHKITRNGITIPVIRVDSFHQYPFFTSDKAKKKGCVNVIKENSLYFRDDEAKTVVLVNEMQFKKILDICTRNRQDEILREFTDLLQKATGKTLSSAISSKEETPDDWIPESRQRMRQALDNAKRNE